MIILYHLGWPDDPCLELSYISWDSQLTPVPVCHLGWPDDRCLELSYITWNGQMTAHCWLQTLLAAQAVQLTYWRGK